MNMWLMEMYQESLAKLSVNNEFIAPPPMNCIQIMLSEGHLQFGREGDHKCSSSANGKNKTTKTKQAALIKHLLCAENTPGLSQVLPRHPFIHVQQLNALCYSRHFLYLPICALLGSLEFLADRVCKSTLNDTAHL